MAGQEARFPRESTFSRDALRQNKLRTSINNDYWVSARLARPPGAPDFSPPPQTPIQVPKFHHTKCKCPPPILHATSCAEADKGAKSGHPYGLFGPHKACRATSPKLEIQGRTSPNHRRSNRLISTTKDCRRERRRAISPTTDAQTGS